MGLEVKSDEGLALAAHSFRRLLNHFRGNSSDRQQTYGAGNKVVALDRTGNFGLFGSLAEASIVCIEREATEHEDLVANLDGSLAAFGTFEFKNAAGTTELHSLAAFDGVGAQLRGNSSGCIMVVAIVIRMIVSRMVVILVLILSSFGFAAGAKQQHAASH